MARPAIIENTRNIEVNPIFILSLYAKIIVGTATAKKIANAIISFIFAFPEMLK